MALSLINRIALKMNCLTWLLFYYIVHVLGLVLVDESSLFSVIFAIGLIIGAFLMSQAEQDAIKDFELNFSCTTARQFYIACGFLIATVFVGILAELRPEKPSIWIAYCIFLCIFSAIGLAVSVSAFRRAQASTLPGTHMIKTMETYEENSDEALKWDNLQIKFKCCGTYNYKDWQDVRFGRTSLRVPASCCLPKRRMNETDGVGAKSMCGLNLLPNDDFANTKIYPEGCIEPAMNGVIYRMRVLSILGLTCSLAHTALTILTIYLVLHKKV